MGTHEEVNAGLLTDSCAILVVDFVILTERFVGFNRNVPTIALDGPNYQWSIPVGHWHTFC